MSNEADASYKTVVREAEARSVSLNLEISLNAIGIIISQQQALMEASAIAQQVEAISRSLTPSSITEPSAENREKALQILVELKRLEQLKAIASSQSNSTYFFGDKASLGAGLDGSGGALSIDYAQSVKAGLKSQTGESGNTVGGKGGRPDVGIAAVI